MERMPRCGSLWIWKGNAYTVVGTFSSSIHIKEEGSGLSFYQTYDFYHDRWTEPSRY